jgi:hypothetical protein
MSIGLSNFRAGCVIAAIFAWCLLPCDAQTRGRSRGRSIELSVPRTDEDTNSLQKLTIKKDGPKELGDDLFKTLPGFSPQSSLDGIAAPLPANPPPSAAQTKRLKEMLDRQKNWVFLPPEDLMGAPSVEEILKAPEYDANGREKKKVPTLEQYYERITAKRLTGKHGAPLKDGELLGSNKRSSLDDGTTEQAEPDLPNGVKDKAQELKRLFQTDMVGDASAQAATSTKMADPFGRTDNTLTKEQMLEHKKLMDDYHTFVDASWHPPTAAGSFDKAWGLPSAPQPAKSPSAGLPTTPSATSHTGLDAQMDVLHPLLGPPGLPDINARAVGQTRPPLPQPTAEAPKVVAPTFSAPRRSF